MSFHNMRASKTKTEIRQEQIATAPLELMAKHGPRVLKVTALVRRIGVVPSAIYRHHSGKEAALDAVRNGIAARLQENVTAVREETPGALDRLHRLLTRLVHTVSVMFPGLIHPAAILRLTSYGGFDVATHVGRTWRLFSGMQVPRRPARAGEL